MKKLKEILLVDDGRGTNSLNRRLLEEMGVVEKISIALNGLIALNYLTTKNKDGVCPNPEIIFLDINMPVMNGYQFLEEYNKINDNAENGVIIVMLTTSISEIDMKKAEGYKSVKGYQFKPLTKEKVMQIIEQLSV